MSSLEYAAIIFVVLVLCIAAFGLIVAMFFGQAQSTFNEEQARKEAEELLRHINRPTRRRIRAFTDKHDPRRL
jgi:flagellar basal body-associated protein FliL